MLLFLAGLASVALAQCNFQTTCATCLAQPNCGWCSGTTSSSTTRCAASVSSPSTCFSGWRAPGTTCPTTTTTRAATTTAPFDEVIFFLPFIVMASVIGTALVVVVITCCCCKCCLWYGCCGRFGNRSYPHITPLYHPQEAKEELPPHYEMTTQVAVQANYAPPQPYGGLVRPLFLFCMLTLFSNLRLQISLLCTRLPQLPTAHRELFHILSCPVFVIHTYRPQSYVYPPQPVQYGEGGGEVVNAPYSSNVDPAHPSPFNPDSTEGQYQ